MTGAAGDFVAGFAEGVREVAVIAYHIARSCAILGVAAAFMLGPVVWATQSAPEYGMSSVGAFSVSLVLWWGLVCYPVSKGLTRAFILEPDE